MRTTSRFALLAVVGLLLLGTLVSPGSAWLTGYAYRQMHNITGCSTWTANQTDYPILFTVSNTSGISFNDTAYTNGHSQPTWYDIRFTNTSDGEYDYWIESTNATSAQIWVKIPEIANSSTASTLLYMYYGNPLETPNSNATTVFEFYDDFEDASFDTTKWSRVTAGTTTATEASGYIRLYSAAGNTNHQHIYTLTNYTYNHAIECVYAQSTYRYRSAIGFWDTNTSSEDNPAFNRTAYTVAGGFATPSDLTTIGGTMSVVTSESGATQYRGSLTSTKDYQAMIRDSTRVAYRTDTLNNTYYYAGAGEVSAFSPNTNYLDLYWFAIRNSVDPEPLNLWWGEEYSPYDYISYDKSSYALGENANITTYFPSEFWDTPNYTYFFYLFRSTDLVTPIDSVSVTTQTQYHTIATADYGVGTYYAIMYMTHIGTGTTYFVDYDYADFVNGVTISGLVFNATSGASIIGATVNVTQGVSSASYTSTVAGYATATPLNVGQAITITGAMAGYTPYSSTFTPLGAANITKAIPLVPNDTACFWNATDNSTSLVGLVDELPYYIPANGAHLNLSNATWYSNITLGITGWYMFEDLNNTETYSLTACKSGFDDYIATVTTGTDDLTWYNFTLGANFTLTVNIKDASSGAPITSNVTVVIDNGAGWTSTDTTSSGSATFPGLAGSFDIEASCLGYTTGTSSVTMDADKTVTISLSAPTSSPVYYTPHDVKIVVQDAYGNPLDGTSITITPIDTTLDSWDWLQSVLGVPTAEEVDTTVLTGTCDYMGSATFVLVREVRYKIDLINVADGVNETQYLYPKDDLYVFTVGVTGGYEEPTSLTSTITWSFTNTTHNSTHENITFTYYDSGNTTTNVSFWVKTHLSPVSTCYQTYCSSPNSCTATYTCAANSGQEYYAGFDAVTTGKGNLTATQAFQFQKLVNLGISSAYYPWIAAAFLIVIGAIFSVISVRFGAILVPMFAWMFFYMKWLTLTWQQTALLTILLVIGVFAYIRKQEDKVGG